MSIKRKAPDSAATLRGAAENGKGCSKPIHNSIRYFIIAITKSQTDFVLAERSRNAPLSGYRAEIMQLAIHRAEWLETCSKGQG